MTAAALLRTVDHEKPTLLLDQLDAAFGGEKEYKEALGGILNEGFRRGGNFRKCEGKNHELRVFEVFCPKALAGIGRIPETIASRSIVIVDKSIRRLAMLRGDSLLWLAIQHNIGHLRPISHWPQRIYPAHDAQGISSEWLNTKPFQAL